MSERERQAVLSLSDKVLIRPELPTEETSISDRRRIETALRAQGYRDLYFPLATLRKLYPVCREEDTAFTVTLVHETGRTRVTDIEKGDTRHQHYGLAVDYGSTTIVFRLIDLCSGEALYECREVNRQRAYGRDILTRIIHGMQAEEGRRELHDATAATFDDGFEDIRSHTGIDPRRCGAMVIAGNTCMIHFLLELDAWTVFSAPYAPVTTEPGFFGGEELGLDFQGSVFIMPSASNYIGGDIVSGMLTIDLTRSDGISAFFDVGTNGELVLGNREWIFAGAGAAGPALEGDISKYGMIAGDGAIDHVRISGPDITFTTISGMRPEGICGSGIIDLLAEMRLNGWVDVRGTLNPEASPRVRWIEEEKQYAAVYADESESADGQPLYFSQSDILQYIQTKAAAHTMVDLLLDAAGITQNDIDRMYLTGAFCNHSDLESAIAIGMFPDMDRSRYVPLKNSSLEGAAVLLKDRGRMADIRYFLDTVYCVQFASMPDFMVRMQAAKFIPHTDMDQYPTVAAKLAARGVK